METIAAVATPAGEGGIGIVRVSGPLALAILLRIFRPVQKNTRFVPRQLYLGHVVDACGEKIDQVLAVYMRGPKTYTGEDVIEIHTHGGPYLVREALRAALAAGARMAEPGEFTERAFLSGKLDLVQAEAVIDLIRASAGAAAKQAERHLDGELSKQIGRFREELLAILSQIAASVDFPEHDIPELAPQNVQASLSRLQDEIASLLQTSFAGKLLREGLQVVIAGRPNVGKSSLMNALVGRDKAIVTEFAGTTRDIVEEYIVLDGIPVRLMDTAGLHITSDPVEEIGVARARQAILGADLTLVVLDQSTQLEEEDYGVLGLCGGVPHLIVCNKGDLGRAFDSQCELGGKMALHLSSKTGEGLDELKKAIVAKVYGNQLLEGSLLVANARQEELLRRALQAVGDAARTLLDAVPVDMLSVDLNEAYDCLGAILGETVDGGIISGIFGRFCVGK